MRTIYLDMDGVVADFNKFSSDLLGRQVGCGEQDLTDEEWKILASVDNIYAKIPLIEESTRLVAMAKIFQTRFYVEFLTAIPRRTTMPTAEQDKKEWLSKYYPGFRMNIGPFSADKHKWCKPGDILIDDKFSNIMDWHAAGGVAIYHKADFDITIKHLLYAIDKDTAIMLA